MFHTVQPRRAAIFIALIGAACLIVAGASGAPGQGPHDKLLHKATEKGAVQVLVQLDARRHQDAVVDRIHGKDAAVRIKYSALPFLALKVGPGALRKLIASPEVVAIQEDKPEPPALDSSIPVINGDDVFDLGFDGSGQTVAILDTGIDDDHPFYGAAGARIVSQACYSDGGGDGDATTSSLCPGGVTSTTAAGSADVEGNAGCDTMGSVSNCDHGGHVAGIAAGDGTGISGAPAHGVAPAADIIAIQVFTRFTQASDCSPNAAPCILTYPSDQILGLQRVLALDATFTISSANMSLGGGNNASACDGDSRKPAIDNLLAAGIATVISAGNNGFGAAVGAPGCISTAVTVGATDDSDSIAGFSNRGTLLDLFAPGVNVTSSIVDDTFGSKSGTSMAAPFVTGAFAVLRDAYPSATIATLLGYLQSTGVSINYSSGGSNITTPRIDLLAALQAGNTPPTLTRDKATVTVNEGQTAANTGTFGDTDGGSVSLTASVGTVTDAGGGNWAWSFGTSDGPTESQTVTITATDDKDESTSVTFSLVVDNVAPVVVIDPGQVTAINEGDTLPVLAGFTDPGWADTYSSTIDFGFGSLDAGVTTVTTQGPPEDAGAASGSRQYGDDGSFGVEVAVTDDDGGSGDDGFTVTVANVKPTAAIDKTGATLVNGIPTFLAQEGVPLPFSGRSTDPGSDDLTLGWDWGDGAPSPDMSTTYFANAPTNTADPDPSPDVNARDVTDSSSHAFGAACFYTVTFDSGDDDGGNADDDTVSVIITGTATEARGPGYWQTQYRPRPTAFSEERRQCYLAITRFMSSVFSETRSLASPAEAFDVMFLKGNGGSALQKLDRELLTAWLNFANGPFALATLVDTNGDDVADTAFSSVMAAAEAVRNNPLATEPELLAQRDILSNVNGS